MTKYVVGFAFNSNKVLLIKKLKPKWQCGYLNGVGGKIEPGETAYMAMIREFTEEVGVLVTDWREFCITKARDGEVHFFVTFSSISNIRQMEAEEPIWVENLDGVIDNLNWLIPMAKAKVPVFSEVKEL